MIFHLSSFILLHSSFISPPMIFCTGSAPNFTAVVFVVGFFFCALYGIASRQKVIGRDQMQATSTRFEPSSDLPFSASSTTFSLNSTIMTTSPETVVKYRIVGATNTVLPFDKMFDLFSDPSSGIHHFFNTILRDHFSRYSKAYFFECPAVSASTLQRDFEFVLVSSNAFERMRADSMAFREHLTGDNGTNDIISFLNIRRDATLVVPRFDYSSSSSADKHADDSSGYGHLASFTMTAPHDQANRLWQRVFAELKLKLRQNDRERVWLSTSGLGVPWLHIRLDSVPKYYNWRPYKET
jgi:elongation factor P hydroxylase